MYRYIHRQTKNVATLLKIDIVYDICSMDAVLQDYLQVVGPYTSAEFLFLQCLYPHHNRPVSMGVANKHCSVLLCCKNSPKFDKT